MPVPTSPALTGARQSTLRTSNLALVARTVHASEVPLSRADVAAVTSMTRATAARLVDELVAGGILDELERPATPRRGRPVTPLVPGARIAALGLQIDVGYLAARVINLRGDVLAERVEAGDFAGSDPAATLQRLGAASDSVLAQLPAGTRLVGAGLALPGIVTVNTGLLRRAPNLGWSDLRPAELLDASAVAGLPLTVGNEANLAAQHVAQSAPGRPSALRDFLYLSGEIGIGGAAVRAGQVMMGRHGWAGEIGHVCVDPAGPVCRCGSTGCLEQYAGRHALTAAVGLEATAPPEKLLALVAAGEPAARDTASAAARALSIALAGIINVLDIPTVVLGGYLGQIASILRPDLEKLLQARVISSQWSPPTVQAAAHSPAPGATGAAFQELTAVIEHPARWFHPTAAAGSADISTGVTITRS